jgi:hypothetical protein
MEHRMTIQDANLALRFLLELCALVALGYWGMQTGSGTITKIGLGIGAPLLAAVVWGLFVSPRAAVPVPAPVHLALQVAVFGSAAAALVATDRPVLAGIFALLVVANALLMYAWEQ